MGGFSAAAGFAGDVMTTLFNKSQASKNRAFQERAYKHRYQWQMEDMRRSGLNPLLSYKSGAGTAPPGAQAKSADFGRAGDRINTGTLVSAQRKLLEQQARKAGAEADILGPRANLYERLEKQLDPLLDWLEGMAGPTTGDEVQKSRIHVKPKKHKPAGWINYEKNLMNQRDWKPGS